MTGLDGEGISYGIHTTPVDTDDEILEKCSNEYLGGVFNPFEVPFIAGRDGKRVQWCFAIVTNNVVLRLSCRFFLPGSIGADRI